MSRSDICLFIFWLGGLEELEALESLERLGRLEGLGKLEALEGLEDLERPAAYKAKNFCSVTSKVKFLRCS